MPQISSFFGIIIRMFYDEHNPPHFHAQYGEHKCCIDIRTLGVIEGYFPARALGLVVEWAILHQNELNENWCNVEEKRPLNKIAPLQ
jgi:hypothetical protein